MPSRATFPTSPSIKKHLVGEVGKGSGSARPLNNGRKSLAPLPSLSYWKKISALPPFIPSAYQVLCVCPFFFGASFSLERDNSIPRLDKRKDKYTETNTNV